LNADGGCCRPPYALRSVRSVTFATPPAGFLAATAAEIHSSPHLSAEVFPVSPGGVQKTPGVAVAAARSPPRSGRRRRHCAPRLASCLSHTGPGSRELPARTTRRWGGFLYFPHTSLSQNSRSGASTGAYHIYIYNNNNNWLQHPPERIIRTVRLIPLGLCFGPGLYGN
jgi:hypothetical protein